MPDHDATSSREPGSKVGAGRFQKPFVGVWDEVIGAFPSLADNAKEPLDLSQDQSVAPLPR